jgi:aspartyl/asparaginyl-tRNA synthetase
LAVEQIFVIRCVFLWSDLDLLLDARPSLLHVLSSLFGLYCVYVCVTDASSSRMTNHHRVLECSRAQDLPIQVTDCARSEAVLAAQAMELAEVRENLAAIEDKESAAAKALEERARRLGLGKVGQKLRLDNRFIDLRTSANRAIFCLQSGVCALFREFLMKNNFTEIHSPKLIGVASEGGSDVFEVKYFDRYVYVCCCCCWFFFFFRK